MEESRSDTKTKTVATRWLIRETLGNIFLIVILFGIVGRLDWWNGWALSVIYILWTLGTVLFILPVNPQMLAERARPKPGGKKWDVVMVSAMGVFLLMTYIVACLDVRLGWAIPFPLPVQIAGGIVAVLGYDILLVWSMVANAYFTAIVRIQEDRQHKVATGGPYRFVRHPGYVGGILCYLATPFLLGSPWALIPAVGTAVIVVIRTALEDKMLQSELSGYKEYAERVRYRLVPGIW
ncbi:MAG: isoprenylcysteine carboxylmethyltransferase family protein [Anaerolineae bacterium]|nr:isoprenylcysteine carboxylmethyltransferase family protein [Anaerolineae bacterium]